MTEALSGKRSVDVMGRKFTPNEIKDFVKGVRIDIKRGKIGVRNEGEKPGLPDDARNFVIRF